MPPFTLRNLDHVVLRVLNLATSIKFYTEVLGCTVERMREDLGLVHLRTGTSMIDLVSVNGKLGVVGGVAAGTEGRNVDHLCLRIDPFEEDQIVAHLRLCGIEPHGPVVMNFGAEGTGPSIYVSDPDGNTIELKGRSTPEHANSDAY